MYILTMHEIPRLPINEICKSMNEDKILSSRLADRICLALDQSLLDIGEVAFSLTDQSEIMCRLKTEGYGEPDLVSINVMSRHMYIHRKAIVDEFRYSLFHLDDSPVGYLDASQIKDDSLRRAVDLFENHREIPRVRVGSRDHLVSLYADHLIRTEGGVYLLCVCLLGRVRSLLPQYSEIDDSSIALYLLCLRLEIVAEMARTNLVSENSLWG